MKKAILIVMCVLATGLQAQSTDGGATKIMQELAKRYQGFTSMQIDYTYKVEKDKKVTQTLTGKAQIKGDKYRITFGDQTFFCDGKSMWNYQKASNEVSVYTYEESDDDALNPAKMLKSWQKEYTAKLIREDVEKGVPVQIIDLTPRQGQSYYKIRIVIDRAKNVILRTAIYEKNNTIHTYHFDKFVPNASIADGIFVFDKAKYPKVEVNDMR